MPSNCVDRQIHYIVPIARLGCKTSQLECPFTNFLSFLLQMLSNRREEDKLLIAMDEDESTHEKDACHASLKRAPRPRLHKQMKQRLLPFY